MTSRLSVPLNVLRGVLIGLAELVPGVSGGTVALVTGVYERLIRAADHAVSGLRVLVTGPDRLASATGELRRVDWWLVLPVLVGMGAAVLSVAGAMEGFVSGHPEHARGLFLGMVAVSIAVPLRMLPERGAGSARWRDGVVVLLAAVVAFGLVGLASGREIGDPALPVVLVAAAVAVCALALPGVSGSFFLLAVGLYAPTLTAVDERDLGYLAVFAVGAVLGLGSFVQVLRWLLDTHRRVTLLVMAGLMVGSLRALWPWQAESDTDGAGGLRSPYDPWAGPLLLIVVGALVVLALVVVEARREARETAPVPDRAA